MNAQHLTINQLSRRLGLSQRTLFRRLAAGEIKPVPSLRRRPLRFDLAEIERSMENGAAVARWQQVARWQGQAAAKADSGKRRLLTVKELTGKEKP